MIPPDVPGSDFENLTPHPPRYSTVAMTSVLNVLCFRTVSQRFYNIFLCFYPFKQTTIAPWQMAVPPTANPPTTTQDATVASV